MKWRMEAESEYLSYHFLTLLGMAVGTEQLVCVCKRLISSAGIYLVCRLRVPQDLAQMNWLNQHYNVMSDILEICTVI